MKRRTGTTGDWVGLSLKVTSVQDEVRSSRFTISLQSSIDERKINP